MSKPTHQVCPLCRSAHVTTYAEDKQRVYLICCHCLLVSVPPEHFLSAGKEKARYEEHHNSPADPAYRDFLGRLFTPLKIRLRAGTEGLDFGSGNGPTLSVMFEEAGFKMFIYDHFFARHPAVFNRTYDFITATEVVEHLHHPREELDKLCTCLKPGGWLGIMTKQRVAKEKFNNWHNKRDMTQVCFYSRKTFDWLTHRWNATAEFIDNDVVIVRKPFC